MRSSSASISHFFGLRDQGTRRSISQTNGAKSAIRPQTEMAFFFFVVN
jgi:hypothetical protein